MNLEKKDICLVSLTLSVIGGKWKPLILHFLSEGVTRPSELKRLIVGITQKMLTQQLRELETDGVIHRTVYPVVPPHVEYTITEFGWTLAPVMNALYAWGETHQARILAARQSADEKKVTTA